MTDASAAIKKCACGADISRWAARCRECYAKNVIDKATVVEPSAPLNLVDSDTFYYDLDEASDFAGGSYAHPCDEELLAIGRPARTADELVERVVEEMTEEAFEDAYDYVKGRDELRKAFTDALVAFNEAQTASSWIPRTHEVFCIPASGTLTEGGDG